MLGCQSLGPGFKFPVWEVMLSKHCKLDPAATYILKWVAKHKAFFWSNTRLSQRAHRTITNARKTCTESSLMLNVTTSLRLRTCFTKIAWETPGKVSAFWLGVTTQLRECLYQYPGICGSSEWLLLSIRPTQLLSWPQPASPLRPVRLVSIKYATRYSTCQSVRVCSHQSGNAVRSSR